MKYNYMCNFGLLTKSLPLVGSGLVGGGLYGGTYVASKKLLGENMNDEASKREVLANTAAATLSGVGAGVTTGLLVKALAKKGLM